MITPFTESLQSNESVPECRKTRVATLDVFPRRIRLRTTDIGDSSGGECLSVLDPVGLPEGASRTESGRREVTVILCGRMWTPESLPRSAPDPRSDHRCSTQPFW